MPNAKQFIFQTKPRINFMYHIFFEPFHGYSEKKLNDEKIVLAPYSNIFFLAASSRYPFQVPSLVEEACPLTR